jgi:uncharacterized protein (DUF1778 family)
VAKTVTVRMEETAYNLIKRAADGERRSISNYLEYAALRYLSGELAVSDEEMASILEDEALVDALREGKKDAETGNYLHVD